MGFDDIATDTVLEWNVTVTSELIDNFAAAISDFNPLHMSHEKAIQAGFETRLLHGVGLIGLISTAVATKLPGEGSILLKIDASFIKPAYLGSELVCSLKVAKKFKSNNTVRFSYLIRNDDLDKLALGSASVMVPSSKY